MPNVGISTCCNPPALRRVDIFDFIWALIPRWRWSSKIIMDHHTRTHLFYPEPQRNTFPVRTDNAQIAETNRGATEFAWFLVHFAIRNCFLFDFFSVLCIKCNGTLPLVKHRMPVLFFSTTVHFLALLPMYSRRQSPTCYINGWQSRQSFDVVELRSPDKPEWAYECLACTCVHVIVFHVFSRRSKLPNELLETVVSLKAIFLFFLLSNAWNLPKERKQNPRTFFALMDPAICNL